MYAKSAKSESKRLEDIFNRLSIYRGVISISLIVFVDVLQGVLIHDLVRMHDRVPSAK